MLKMFTNILHARCFVYHCSSCFSGAGRVIAFESRGERPNGLGEIVVLLSSINLPARDDLPIIFVNVGTLFDVPFKAMTNLG